MPFDTLIYAGTYTEDMSHVPESKGKGIHLFKLDVDTGEMQAMDVVYELENPSFLAIDHKQAYLYACSEVGEGRVTAFAIDRVSGHLTYLNQQSTHGSATAYVSVGKTAAYTLAANYWDGQSIALFPIQEDGSLTQASSTHEHTMPAAKTVPSRQDKSHAHCIVPSPDNHFALVCDLGLDKIMVYKIDTSNHQLVANETPYFDMHPGAGPRHLVFHPSQDIVYVTNELDSTVSVLSFDPSNGQLAHKQTLPTIPEAAQDYSSSSDIHVSPDGKHLYVGNRGHDSLAIYEINPDTGQLTFIEHQPTGGKIPRNFVIDPSGNIVLVAHQDSHNIVSFQRDPQTGKLTRRSTIECPTPVCLKMIKLTD